MPQSRQLLHTLLDVYLYLFSCHQFTTNDSILESSYRITFLTHFLYLLTGPVTVNTTNLNSVFPVDNSNTNAIQISNV